MAPFFELLEAVNDRAQDCGFAVRKRRSNNIDKATGLPTRIDLECHQSRFYGDVVPAHHNKKDQIGVAAASDGSDDEESVRQKYRGTKLSGCAWKAKAVFLKAAQVWVFVIRESDHNHEPDENPWDITIHRKRRQKDEKFRKRLFELALVKGHRRRRRRAVDERVSARQRPKPRCLDGLPSAPSVDARPAHLFPGFSTHSHERPKYRGGYPQGG